MIPKILATFIPAALSAFVVASDVDYSPQYTIGRSVHADRSEAIRYAVEDARRSCRMIMLIEPNTETYSGEVELTKAVQVDQPGVYLHGKWLTEARAECDVFTTR